MVRAGPGGEDGGVALHGRVEGVEMGGRDGVGEGDEAVGVEGAEGALEGVRGEGFGGELGGGEGDEDGAVWGGHLGCGFFFLVAVMVVMAAFFLGES